MKCQYPITPGIAPKCKNKADWKDGDGRVYCGNHGTRGMVRLSAQPSVQRTCLQCGSQSFNDYQGYLKCNVCGEIAN